MKKAVSFLLTGILLTGMCITCLLYTSTSATPIISILNSVAMGATNGVAILVSQALGAKDEKRTNSVIATSFLLAILFAVAVTIFLELCLPHICLLYTSRCV